MQFLNSMFKRTVFNRVTKVLYVCFGFVSPKLCDWLKNLTSLLQPITTETNTNRDFSALTRFPALVGVVSLF